jgi:hypothetical protein
MKELQLPVDNTGILWLSSSQVTNETKQTYTRTRTRYYSPHEAYLLNWLGHELLSEADKNLPL